MAPSSAPALRPRLWHRWFLLSAGLVLLTVVAMLLTQELGFRRGLLGHTNALERERLPAVAERLAEEYAQAGWDRLLRQPGRWRELAMPGLPAAPPRPPHRPPRAPPGPPPFERPAPARAHPPPPPPGQEPPGPAGAATDEPPLEPIGFLQRLSLQDAHGRPLRGPPPSPRAFRLPVLHAGVRIGELALEPMPALQQPADLEFAVQQRRNALLVALAVLLAAILASWFLARLVTRRVSALAEASRRVAAGDADVRLGDMGRDELGELAQDFDRMTEALQHGREARDRWIADISHELRTPLTVLRGELQALQDGIRPLDADALASLVCEADRLAQRVDDLYALALSDQGGLAYRFGEVDLSALVAGVLDAHRPAMTRAGLTLLSELPRTARLARADPARLEQLASNLLSNARRYTDPGGRVDVRILASAAGEWELRIDDSEPGVDPVELPHLLDRRFRGGDGRHRATDGAGLGLAICRNIAEAHGGSVQLGPSPLGGLQVRVRLPAAGGAG